MWSIYLGNLICLALGIKSQGSLAMEHWILRVWATPRERVSVCDWVCSPASNNPKLGLSCKRFYNCWFLIMLTLKYGFDLSSFHPQCLSLQFSDELRVFPGKFKTVSQRLEGDPFLRMSLLSFHLAAGRILDVPLLWLSEVISKKEISTSHQVQAQAWVKCPCWVTQGEVLNSQDPAAYFALCLKTGESRAKHLHRPSAQCGQRGQGWR